MLEATQLQGMNDEGPHTIIAAPLYVFRKVSAEKMSPLVGRCVLDNYYHINTLTKLSLESLHQRRYLMSKATQLQSMNDRRPHTRPD